MVRTLGWHSSCRRSPARWFSFRSSRCQALSLKYLSTPTSSARHDRRRRVNWSWGIVVSTQLTSIAVLTLAHVLREHVVLSLVEVALPIRQESSHLTFAIISIHIVRSAHGLI
jgi:hypothetical protein